MKGAHEAFGICPKPKTSPCSSVASGSELLSAALPSRRCTERGCVFPAGRLQGGVCVYHYRQNQEPAFFCSQQPTMLLLEGAKFILPDFESEDSRRLDRCRLAQLREAILEDAA